MIIINNWSNILILSWSFNLITVLLVCVQDCSKLCNTTIQSQEKMRPFAQGSNPITFLNVYSFLWCLISVTFGSCHGVNHIATSNTGEKRSTNAVFLMVHFLTSQTPYSKHYLVYLFLFYLFLYFFLLIFTFSLSTAWLNCWTRHVLRVKSCTKLFKMNERIKIKQRTAVY